MLQRAECRLRSRVPSGPDVAGLHSWEIAPEAIPEGDIVSTEETDVLVIGAGLAGCCSSIAALEEGAKVITIDKNSECVVARGVHIAGFHTKVQQSLVEQGLLEKRITTMSFAAGSTGPRAA